MCFGSKLVDPYLDTTRTRSINTNYHLYIEAPKLKSSKAQEQRKFVCVSKQSLVWKRSMEQHKCIEASNLKSSKGLERRKFVCVHEGFLYVSPRSFLIGYNGGNSCWRIVFMLYWVKGIQLYVSTQHDPFINWVKWIDPLWPEKRLQ